MTSICKIVTIFCIVFSISTITEGRDLYSLIVDENYAHGLIECIVDVKPCDSEDSEEIKALVLAVLINDCKRCTPIQSKQGREMKHYLETHYPVEWLEVFHRYIY